MNDETQEAIAPVSGSDKDYLFEVVKADKANPINEGVDGFDIESYAKPEDVQKLLDAVNEASKKAIEETPVEDVDISKMVKDATTLKVDPDPLLTAAYVPSEAEAAFRARAQSHTNLNRRHKPAITQERFQELKDRMAEAKALYEESILARRAGEGEKADALEKKVELRRLTYMDSLQLHFAERNGLFEEKDLRALIAADERREKRTAKRRYQQENPKHLFNSDGSLTDAARVQALKALRALNVVVEGGTGEVDGARYTEVTV